MVEITKSIAIELLKNFEINSIESCIVKIFLDERKLKTKNEVLKKVLNKCDEDDKEKIKKFLEKKSIVLDLKKIERFFELLIEDSDRKLNGVFYTPNQIVDYISNKTITTGKEKICDPACGSGSFLIGAVKRIHKLKKKKLSTIIEKQIFGCDISNRSIEHCKILLSLLVLINGENVKKLKFNLHVADSLSFNWEQNYKNGFDVVIGNPPYVRVQNLPKKSREFINKKYSFGSRGSIDLYLPFFELGIKLLSKTGKLGFITPNSYYTSHAAENFRIYLNENKLISKIIDFNHLNIFHGVTAYTCITILDKTKKESFGYAIIHQKKLLDKIDRIKLNKIKSSDLNVKKWILLSKEDFQNISKIESIGKPLGEITEIKNGIATLKDELFLINSNKEDGFYIKESDNKKFLIEEDLTRNIIKASILKTPSDIKKNKLRIIFPYKLVGKTYQPFSEKELKNRFPKGYDYFLNIKEKLSKRDKGDREYPQWFAYGRTQGYNIFGKKIITPAMSPGPRFVVCNSEKTLYYAGMGIFYDGDIRILMKILNSKIFWYYIYKTSKEYKSNFFSLSKNFIENFGVPEFTKKERDFIIKSDQKKVDKFLIKLYGINI